MNTQFYDELVIAVQDAYDNDRPTDVPNFSHWWANNVDSIMEEMRICASKGIRTATYYLPPDWSYYSEDCLDHIKSKFVDGFDVRTSLRTWGVEREYTLHISW